MNTPSQDFMDGYKRGIEEGEKRRLQLEADTEEYVRIGASLAIRPTRRFEMIDQCPNCNAELELAKYHSYHDWASEFQTECPKCETLLDVQVEAEPVFYVKEESAHARCKV